MRARRGLLARVVGVGIVAASVAWGCGGFGCPYGAALDVKWSGRISLTADSPAAVRILQVEISNVGDGRYSSRLNLNWIEIGGNRFEPLWVSLIDLAGGTSTFANTGPGYGDGVAFLTDACLNGCTRSYAIVFRWGSPLAGDTRAVDIDATLEVADGGNAECRGTVGPIDAELTEVVSQRFDGTPRMVSARATGELEVPLTPQAAAASVELRASKELLTYPAVYPTISRIFTGFRPDIAISNTVSVGSTSVIRGGGNPAELEWTQLCAPGADCTLPIAISESFSPAPGAVVPTGPAARWKVQWWVEVRVEVFSAAADLPDGTLTLQPK
jgi:hypothetical protein